MLGAVRSFEDSEPRRRSVSASRVTPLLRIDEANVVQAGSQARVVRARGFFANRQRAEEVTLRFFRGAQRRSSSCRDIERSSHLGALPEGLLLDCQGA